MMHCERSYATARLVHTILEFVGWALVVIGILAALAGLSTGGLFAVFGDPPPIARFMSMLPGLAVALTGLLTVSHVQTSRANVDSAEMARETPALARRRTPGGFQPATGDELLSLANNQGNAAAPNGSAETGHRVSDPANNPAIATSSHEKERACEHYEYKGFFVSRTISGFRANGREFESKYLAEAEVDAQIQRNIARRG